MLDSMFKDLRESGNLERYFKLKDKALFDGVHRINFSERAGFDRASLYNVLRGQSCLRATAEKIASTLLSRKKAP